MTDSPMDRKERGILLDVLTSHYRALILAKSDETLLRQYAALLRFLKSKDAPILEKSSAKHSSTNSRSLPTLSDEELGKFSLDDLEKLVSNESTSRKDLESIAIQRFSVPRGSMRSFSNRGMLVDKLRTLIGNERTHETIGEIARASETKL